MIGVFALQSHYLYHLLPVVAASGLPWRHITLGEAKDVKLVVVAGGEDALTLPWDVPYVYVEHGSGQTYEERSSAYSGGPGHGSCVGFICPNETVEARWLEHYPLTPTIAVGCPKLDPWHRGERPLPLDFEVAITFHWDCNISPFSRWAWPHYRRELPRVVDAWRAQGWIVLGHAHPRAADQLGRFWKDIGVEYVPSWAEVFDRANLLVADNTSLLPEFMSLGRPVVMLNAPWYPRDRRVGGRFWDWAWAGPQVWEPAELEGLDLNGIALIDQHREHRERIVKTVYAATDGLASQRAGAFLTEIYERMT